MKCEHGVEDGCAACRPCQCGCLLKGHFIRYEREDGKPDTGCLIHKDCGGYLPTTRALVPTDG